MPVVRLAEGVEGGGLSLVLVYGGQRHPMDVTPEPRGKFTLLRPATETVSTGAGEVRVERTTGEVLRSFPVLWEPTPETRPALAALRAEVASWPPREAAARLEGALPSQPLAEQLWLSAEIARAWQRADAARAVMAWITAADRALAAGSPTEQSRRLRAAAWNAINGRAFADAETFLGRAESIDGPLDNRAGLVRARVLRAELLGELGELRQANAQLSTAADMAWENGLDADWASALQEVARILDLEGRQVDARAQFERIVPYYAAHPTDRDGGPKFEANYGSILWGGLRAGAFPGGTALAREHLLAACDGFRKRQDSLALLSPLSTLAALELFDGRVDSAERIVAEARAQSPGLASFGGLEMAAMEAELLLAKNRLPEALEAFRNVEDRARAEAAFGLTDRVWRARFGVGRVEHRLGHEAAARVAFGVAIEWLDTLAQRTGVQAGRGVFVAERRALFSAAVERDLAAGDVEAAARVAERARAQTLRAMESAARVDRLTADQRTEWERRIAGIQRRRDAFEAAGAEAGLLSGQALASWRADRARASVDLSRDLDEAHAWLQGLGPSPPVSGDATHLGPNEAMVAFFEGDTRLHIFWRTGGSTDAPLHSRAAGPHGASAARSSIEHGSVESANRVEDLSALDAWLVPRLKGIQHLYVVTGGHEAARQLPVRLASRVTASLLPSEASLSRQARSAVGPRSSSPTRGTTCRTPGPRAAGCRQPSVAAPIGSKARPPLAAPSSRHGAVAPCCTSPDTPRSPTAAPGSLTCGWLVTSDSPCPTF